MQVTLYKKFYMFVYLVTNCIYYYRKKEKKTKIVKFYVTYVVMQDFMPWNLDIERYNREALAFLYNVTKFHLVRIVRRHMNYNSIPSVGIWKGQCAGLAPTLGGKWIICANLILKIVFEVDSWYFLLTDHQVPLIHLR